MDKQIISSAKSAVSDLMKLSLLGESRLWVDYDKKADVLYVNFGHPQSAEDSVLGDDNIIRRSKNGKLIGLTVLNASQY